MEAELRPGDTLRGVFSGVNCRVETLIGEGGQGWVYRVEFNGRPYALKWYNARMIGADTSLRSRLRKAVDRGAPSDQFLWPFDLVARSADRDPINREQFGYLMRLRGTRFIPATALIAGLASASFRALAMACFHLADAFSALHGKGLAYQDISAGNVFIDPATGAIEICDNDNVDIDGYPSVMGGTPEYQPPELVLRQAHASRKTDLYALAVLLFRLLHVGHPLLGKRELAFPNIASHEARTSLFGLQPRFVFDPSDDSNRPVPELHGPVSAHWSIYPKTLRDLFTRAFTVGLFDAEHGRVLESEWRGAMSQLIDAVMICSRCGAENFYDGARLQAKQRTFHCWNTECNAELSAAPPRIGIRRKGARPTDTPLHVVVLGAGARLYPHHTAGGEFDFRAPTAAIVTDGAAPPAHQLENRSAHAWKQTLLGESIEIAPGAAAAVATGTRIEFERTEGEVKI